MPTDACANARHGERARCRGGTKRLSRCAGLVLLAQRWRNAGATLARVSGRAPPQAQQALRPARSVRP